ncbi:MAG: hypothetical protein HOH66_18045 [Rhodospirillaceae bacterium]|nr:hypothetical protein [Rhodospirillaceae bacterium]MBT6119768.1 hypothetical protein [Rhodospirillaceae bacterium]
MRNINLAAAFLAVLFLTAPSAASAAEGASQDGTIRIHGGYVSGVQYMDMDGLTKKAYISGLIEGMLLAPAFGAPNENMEWFYVCTQEIGLNEIRKLLFEYIKNDYDLWENQNPAKNFRAIYQACLERVKPEGEESGEADAKETDEKKADE